MLDPETSTSYPPRKENDPLQDIPNEKLKQSDVTKLYTDYLYYLFNQSLRLYSAPPDSSNIAATHYSARITFRRVSLATPYAPLPPGL